jgi:hypothetical protein
MISLNKTKKELLTNIELESPGFEINENLDNFKEKKISYEHILERGGVEIIQREGERTFMLNEYPKIRGSHERYLLNAPWKRLPVTIGFEINKEIGLNLILGLFGLKSRAYYGEPSTKPDIENKVLMKVPQDLPSTYDSNKYIRNQISLLYYSKNSDNF